MTAAAGLLGFGAAADGALAEYDGVFAEIISESGSTIEASVAQVAFANATAEAGSATDTASSVAAFLNAYSEAGLAGDAPSALAVFASAVTNSAPANDNVSSALAAIASRSESGAASDVATSIASFVASAIEAGSAATSTTVTVGISIIEGGPSLDLNDDSLLGFGALGGGAIAAYGGLIVEVAKDSFSASIINRPSIYESGSLTDALAPSVIIAIAKLETLTALDLVAAKYGVNFSYIDTEIICVRAELRMMRSQEDWRTAAAPEEKDARQLPAYKPRAETRKRAC